MSKPIFDSAPETQTGTVEEDNPSIPIGTILTQYQLASLKKS